MPGGEMSFPLEEVRDPGFFASEEKEKKWKIE